MVKAVTIDYNVDMENIIHKEEMGDYEKIIESWLLSISISNPCCRLW